MLSPLEQFKITSIFSVKICCLDFSFTNILFINMLCLLVFIFFIFFLNKKRKIFGGYTLLFVFDHWQFVLENIYKTVFYILYNNLNKNGEKYFPFFLSVFFFLLLNNLIGLIPYSFTATSHIIITLMLSLSIFIGINLISFNKHNTKMLAIFIPTNTTFFLALLLIPIEFISYIFKPISLGVRLFANIMAGHTLLVVILTFSWSIITENLILLFQTLPLITIIILLGLEFGIALIQTYVFILLSCIYLNDGINL